MTPDPVQHADDVRPLDPVEVGKRAGDTYRLNHAISLLRQHRLADRWPLNDIIVQLGQIQDGIYGPLLNDGSQEGRTGG